MKRGVVLWGGPQDGRVIEIDGGVAIEIPTCETVFSPEYEIHRYELSDPYNAHWVSTVKRGYLDG